MLIFKKEYLLLSISFIMLSQANIKTQSSFDREFSEKKQYIEGHIKKIHDYFDKYTNLDKKNQFNCHFKTPKILKTELDLIYNLLFDFLYKDLEKNNQFHNKFRWLLKHRNNNYREAAAYYIAINRLNKKISKKNWRGDILDDYLSLLNDSNHYVQIASIYSLMRLIIKEDFIFNLNNTTKTKILNSIDNLYNKSSSKFIQGLACICFSQFPKEINWQKIYNDYSQTNNDFLKLCIVKTFILVSQDEIASSWGYGIISDYGEACCKDNSNKFKRLCASLGYNRTYQDYIYQSILYYIILKEDDDKLTLGAIKAMKYFLQGHGIKVGNRNYTQPYIPNISHQEKRRTYFWIEGFLEHNNIEIATAALGVISQLLMLTNNQFDLKVIYKITSNMLYNYDNKIQKASIKILANLIYKNFQPDKVNFIINHATESLFIPTESLFSLYTAFASKRYNIEEILEIFLKELEFLKNTQNQIQNQKYLKKLFNLGEQLIIANCETKKIISNINNLCNTSLNQNSIFIKFCNFLKKHTKKEINIQENNQLENQLNKINPYYI